MESEDSLPYSQKSTLDSISGQINPVHSAPTPLIKKKIQPTYS